MLNFAGCLTVTLNPVPLALQNELVEIKATIRSFPKCQSVTWMKDNQCINTTDPKYEGSIANCEFPVLCIKEVKEEDTGVYKVIARNELGEGESSQDLEVIGSKFHSRFKIKEYHKWLNLRLQNRPEELMLHFSSLKILIKQGGKYIWSNACLNFD